MMVLHLLKLFIKLLYHLRFDIKSLVTLKKYSDNSSRIHRFVQIFQINIRTNLDS